MSTQNLTYELLIGTVLSYTERHDDAFDEKVPWFITLAENRIAADMKQQGFQTVVTGTLPLTGILPKPAFWRETISFQFKDEEDRATGLQLRSLEYAQQYAASEPSGVPRYYADYDAQHFLIVPTPVEEAPFQLVYYARLQPLTSENQTNWMTMNMPQVLLYATLLEGSIWRKEDTEVVKYMQLYKQAKAAILGENMERISDRSQVVTRG